MPDRPNHVAASLSSAQPIISVHKLGRLSFMFYFVYASSNWISGTFKEESSDQFTTSLKAAFLQLAGHQVNSNNTQEDEREPDFPTQGSLLLANEFLYGLSDS